MRPQLRPRAAALVQRLQAEQTRPASLQALEGSKWGGPCAERGPHQRRESRPEPPLAAVQQSGAPSTGSRHADDEPRGRAGRPAAPQQPEDDAWCPPLARIPALQQLLSSSGVAASAAEQAASRSRHSFPGSRGQHDDGGALTPTSRGAPLSRPRHGSGAGRLHGGSPANCAAGLNDTGSAGRVGSDLSCAQPPSGAYARDGDGRGLPARATSSPLGRAEACAVGVSDLGARGVSLTTGRPSSAADAARRESIAELYAATEQSNSEATAVLGQLAENQLSTGPGQPHAALEEACVRDAARQRERRERRERRVRDAARQTLLRTLQAETRAAQAEALLQTLQAAKTRA